jgi:NAD(P)H dehydrogenase (quinone)
MNRVLVLYHSREDGYTDLMAKAVAEGAREAGAEVILANTSEARFDPDAYRRFDAAAFGTPDYYSYVAGTLKTFADNLYSREGKLPGLFYSHGGGNVREPFEKLFKYLGGKKIGDTVESSGKPSAAILRTCRKLGAESGERSSPAAAARCADKDGCLRASRQARPGPGGRSRARPHYPRSERSTPATSADPN